MNMNLDVVLQRNDEVFHLIQRKIIHELQETCIIYNTVVLPSFIL